MLRVALASDLGVARCSSVECPHRADFNRHLLRCSKCRAPYCSRDCQKAHWPDHKKVCPISYALRGRCDEVPPQFLRSGNVILPQDATLETKKLEDQAADVIAADSAAAESDKVDEEDASEPEPPSTADEYLDGVIVEDSKSPLGLVMVAARDFAVDEIVLRERPMLTWKAQDMSDFFHHFAHSTGETRGQIMDEMYHPSRNSDPPTPLSVRLADIVGHNAHRTPGSKKHGSLFRLASKAEHSCDPNTAYRKSKDGARILTYVALKPIKKGDRISFEYLDSAIETPLFERRARLFVGKGFMCCCRRCLGPEMSRPLNCGVDGCRGVALRTTAISEPTENVDVDQGMWTCLECGKRCDDTAMEAQISGEARLSSAITSYRTLAEKIITMLRDRDVEEIRKMDPSVFFDEAEKVFTLANNNPATALPPLHFLHVRSLVEVARLAHKVSAILLEAGAPEATCQTIHVRHSLALLQIVTARERIQALYWGNVDPGAAWRSWIAAPDEERMKPQPQILDLAPDGEDLFRCGWRWDVDDCDKVEATPANRGDAFDIAICLLKAKRFGLARVVLARYAKMLMRSLTDEEDIGWVRIVAGGVP